MMLAPFLLDDKSREEPTEMGLVFWVGDVKCEYSVSILKDVVQYEKMVHYPLGRAALIYERRWNRETTSSEITIGSTLKVLAKQKYVLEGQVLPYLTVLGAYKKSCMLISVTSSCRFLPEIPKWWILPIKWLKNFRR